MFYIVANRYAQPKIHQKQSCLQIVIQTHYHSYFTICFLYNVRPEWTYWPFADMSVILKILFCET